MSYPTIEASRYDGQPVALYRFESPAITRETRVFYDPLSYADQVAAEAAGWTATNTTGDISVTWNSDHAVRWLPTSIHWHMGAGSTDGQAQMSRTIALAPNTAHTIRLLVDRSDPGFEFLELACTVGATTVTDATNTKSPEPGVVELACAITTDNTGNVAVAITKSGGYPILHNHEYYFAGLRAFVSATIAAQVYPITSDGLSHVFRGDTYEPAIVIEGGLEWGSGEVAGGEMELTLPRDHAVALLVRGGLPVQPITLTRYRVHRPDIAAGTSYATPFIGQITKAVVKGAACVLTIANARSLLDGKRPRVKCQKQCNWSLGDAYCGVNLADFAYTGGTITAISGKTVTVSGLASDAGTDLTRFQFGFLVGPSGESCQIEQQDSTSGSDDVVLMAAPKTLEVGQAVTVHWGCDLSYGATGCARFGNIDHFGGFTKIPTRNPYVGAGVQP